MQELIHAYRVRGHLMADTDPLEYKQRRHQDLDVTSHGLTLWDLDRTFATGGFGGQPFLKLRKILGILRDSYCRTIGVEYMHIQDPEQREWIQSKIEVGYAKTTREEQLRIVRRLNAAEAFETFLQTKFVGQKRFSLEGGESVIALLDRILSRAAEDELDEVCIGMPHRGRLNVLANIAGKSYGQIFREFEGKQDPRSVQGSGDVKYHLGTEGNFTAEGGRTTKVYLAANPSHLEAVNPVLEGIVRAKQDRLNLAGEDFTVLPVLMHGDAAFAGQGVVAETLNLSQLRGYRTGGTVHVVINNQVGFTTSPSSSRSSTYSTDVARMIQAPIFHVNGDDPEACVRVAELAYEFRKEFHKDVVVDMVCYRRRGHNEGDDPSMTQPLMYNLIEAKRSVRKLYTESLIGRGDITVEDAEAALRDYQQQLERVFVETKATPKEAEQGADATTPAPTPRATPASSAGRPGAERRRHRPLLDRHGDQHRGAAAHRRGVRRRARGLHRAPRAAPGSRSAPPACARAAIDWATGELHRVRVDAARGHPGAPGRAGQPARHLRAAPRGAHRQGERRRVDPAALPRRGSGQVLGLRLPAVRVRGHGFRVRLLRRAARRPGDLGGAVRRLRQRRADHHRRVHLELGAEVGPALLGRAPPAARLRGPGAGPLLGPHRALPHDVRREQHDRRLPVDARVVLPPAAPSGLRASASPAGRLHPEVDAAPQGGEQRPRGLHDRHVPPGHVRRGITGEVSRVLIAAGKVVYELLGERDKRGDTSTAVAAARAVLPAPATWPGGRSQVPGRRGRRGCRTSRATRVRGRSWRSTCPRRWPSRARPVAARRRPRRVASPATGSTKKHAAQQADLIAQAFDR